MRPLLGYDRLGDAGLVSEDVDESTKQRLREQQAALNPFALPREIEERLRPMQIKTMPALVS